jgi:hypothetical protein
LYGKLAGDSTLTALLGTPPAGWSQNIYLDQAPDDAPFPYLIFSRQSSVPTYANATTPAFEEDVWLVKAVDRNTTADQAEAIQARVDALLTDGTLSVSGAEVTWLRRQSDVVYPETVDGVRYLHAGSLYRLVLEPT